MYIYIYGNVPFKSIERKSSKMKLSPIIPSGPPIDPKDFGYKKESGYDILIRSAEKNPII